ncbi:hypothetical protein EJ08DRAFT_694577 [Tothia fuscella]|uniref:Uncharacterized protein n=1 Tax=Tothia fuscella TaxID=1048955 RepID=A0A9P4NYA4_9PEZI|nr:hypothetical protein EJ08DRAFT_694577 [Tothia fuscella]
MEKMIDKVLSSEENEACRRLHNLTFQYLEGDNPRDFKGIENTVTMETLLNFFIAEDKPRKTRRWAGILLEALLSNCSPLRDHIIGLQETLPALGAQILEGAEDLKLVAATIVRALTNSQRLLRLFWPTDTLGSQFVKRFPLGGSQSSSWVEKLSHFQDDVQSQNKTASNSITAPGLCHGQQLTLDDKEVARRPGTVYFIIQDEITITLTPPNRKKIFFIDLPFNQIASYEIEERILLESHNSQRPKKQIPSQRVIAQLVIKLKSTSGAGKCLLNTKEATFNKIVLASDTVDQVEALAAALQEHLKGDHVHQVLSSQAVETETISSHRIVGSQSIHVGTDEDGPNATVAGSPPQSGPNDIDDQGSQIRKIADDNSATRVEVRHLDPVKSTRTAAKMGSHEPVPLKPDGTSRRESRRSNTVSDTQSFPPSAPKVVILKSTEHRAAAHPTGASQAQKQPSNQKSKLKGGIDVYDIESDDEDEKLRRKKVLPNKSCRPKKLVTYKGTAKKDHTPPKRSKGKGVQTQLKEESDDDFQGSGPVKPAFSAHQRKHPKTRAQAKATSAPNASQNIDSSHLVMKQAGPLVESTKTSQTKPIPEKQAKNPPASSKRKTRESRVIPDSEDHITEEDIVADVDPGFRKTRKVRIKQEPLHAKAVQHTKPQKAKPDPLKSGSVRLKPGSSQAAALVLSSEKDSDSSDDEVEVTKVNSLPPPSSPPKPDHPDQQQTELPPAPRVRQPTSTHLVDEKSVRKAAIVSFDRSGPRNQGIPPATPKVSSGTKTFREDEARMQLPNKKHETQKTQAWYGQVGTMNSVMSGETEPQEEPSLPSARHRMLSSVAPMESAFPEIEGVVGELPYDGERAHRFRQSPPEKTPDVSVVLAEASKLAVNKAAPLVATLGASQRTQAPSGTTREIATVSKSRITKRRSSQLSQRSVMVDGQGSPVHTENTREALIVRDDTTEYVRSNGHGASHENEQLQAQLQSQNHPVFPPREVHPVSGHVMSSNQKPVPGSPEAESQAISGHAPESVVQAAVARSQRRAVANPFIQGQATSDKQSAFLQKLRDAAEIRAKLVADEEKTLVEDDPMVDATMSDGTSDSSCDEDQEHMQVDDADVQVDGLEDRAWEAAVQPRHRRIVDVLGRVTRRLVSHMVDSETAVDDIVDQYRKDGTFLIEQMENSHQEERLTLLSGLRVAAHKMVDEYEKTREKYSGRMPVELDVDAGLQYWKQEREKQMAQLTRLEC